jgi:hypothetical protein
MYLGLALPDNFRNIGDLGTFGLVQLPVVRKSELAIIRRFRVSPAEFWLVFIPHARNS